MKKIIVPLVAILTVGILGFVFFSRSAAPLSSSGLPETDGTGQISETSGTKQFTLAEVQAHNSSASCFAAIDGAVYDLTDWIRQHPGGPAKIISICGTDATAAFAKQHGDQPRAEQILTQFKIGTLQAT